MNSIWIYYRYLKTSFVDTLIDFYQIPFVGQVIGNGHFGILWCLNAHQANLQRMPLQRAQGALGDQNDRPASKVQ